MIVIEGLKGQPVAELWSAHPLSQAPYEQGRDPSWAHPANACEGQAASRREARLPREHARLNPLGGALTIARKKAPRGWAEPAPIARGGPAERRPPPAYPGAEGRAPVRGLAPARGLPA
jgi:hypothetical protein